MELTWIPPANDGGAQIEKYIIEKKEKGKQWQKATEVSGDANRATVKNLSEGKEYEFRVVAVNKAGPGAPSEPSRAQIAKARFVAPRIDKQSIKTVTVKSGQPANLDIQFIAEPLPTCTWSRDGKEVVQDGEKYKMQLAEKLAKLSFTSTKRSDTAKYHI